MNKKRYLKPWQIAVIHTTIAGMIIPMIILAVYINIFLILHKTILNINKDFLFNLGAEIIQILSIWIGAKLSANLINKKYEIILPKKVILLSTVYLGIFLLIGFVLSFINSPTISNISLQVFFVFLIGAPLSVMVFYYESQRRFI